MVKVQHKQEQSLNLFLSIQDGINLRSMHRMIGFCLGLIIAIGWALAMSSILEARQIKRNGDGAEAAYEYKRLGNRDDVKTKTVSGVALVGGGSVPDEAWLWLCNKSGGGDFLILTATKDDGSTAHAVDYLCNENSVSTLTIPSRGAANDPFVVDKIRKAEAIFISGGEQGNYIRFWQGTSVQRALNEKIASGVPFAGVSAGLAVLGEYAYSGLNGGASSDETLKNPYNDRVTITHDFLEIPVLKAVITDTHFVARQRLGRMLGFMARIREDGFRGNVRGIGVDEQSAVLVEPNGSAVVVGRGNGGYFAEALESPTVCRPDSPLTMKKIEVQRVGVGGYFSLASWTGPTSPKYEVNVEAGEVRSGAPPGY